MTDKPPTQPNPPIPTCSFCGRTEEAVEKLISGPAAYICDKCIKLSISLIEKQPAGSGGPFVLKHLKPREIKERLDEYIIGQEEAKKTITEGSFSDWLNVLKEGKPETEFEETLKTQETDSKIKDTPRTDKKLQQKSIIDKIIEKNPGQIRFKEDQKFFASDNKAKESLFENEDIVTATLADIYAKQGNIPKAIRAYEILSLKFPQKSAYFASLIENLKKK